MGLPWSRPRTVLNSPHLYVELGYHDGDPGTIGTAQIDGQTHRRRERRNGDKPGTAQRNGSGAHPRRGRRRRATTLTALTAARNRGVDA